MAEPGNTQNREHPPRFVYQQQAATFRARKTALGLRLLLGHFPSPSQTLIDQVAAAYNRADETGDRVAQELFNNPQLRQANINPHEYLRQAVEQGSAAVDDTLTPSLKTLIQQAETPPLWLDSGKLTEACDVIHRCGRFAMYALGDMALLGGYANSDITKPLSFTGALNGNSSFDRVSETTSFWFDVTTPGALVPGAKGYCSAVKVRVMHALVRQRLLQHPDWNTEEWGLPINQGDSLATNVAFSMLMITGASMMGWRFNDKEIEAVLHLWRYVAFLMGDDWTLLPENREQGVDWLFVIAMGSRINPDDDSMALAKSYLENFLDVPGRPAYKKFVYWFHRMYANWLIPADIRRVLNIPSAYGLGLLPALQFPFIRLMDTAARFIPPFDRWLRRFGRNGQQYIVSSRLQGREVTFADKNTMAR
ncbi:MAG: hypothetical protein CMI03_18190 [Oceanospirillaceae bacterium]|uniref:oxygenase MpaB family protein n=1 Tax=unclassified Thalassolituus TaxID=2624967 RepID=UPI000C4E9167|nr:MULTISPECIES: oxygenase MpaB family protein [unclassified Thalassolituus]MBL36439.1 hypothetical protein [Oceanospirillaceae bacterium]MBS54672.1 hypothetical protein [Oceanospirillaceae bacterium]|tara:strand:- start:2172 stop:3437 length:1266 start_codon:yes stop_codon:yes gene_type:complete